MYVCMYMSVFVRARVCIIPAITNFLKAMSTYV